MSDQPCILLILAFCILPFAQKSQIVLYTKCHACWIVSAVRSLCISLLYFQSKKTQSKHVLCKIKDTKMFNNKKHRGAILWRKFSKETVTRHLITIKKNSTAVIFRVYAKYEIAEYRCCKLVIAWLRLKSLIRNTLQNVLKLWINIL